MFETGVRYIGPREIFIESEPKLVNFWDYGKEFDNELVVVIGGGPSHRDLDLNLLSNVNFLVVNSACRKVEKIAKKKDILYFSDNSWNENFPNLADNWKGRVVTSNRHAKARMGDRVNRIDISKLTEFMQVKSDYVQASSGHTAVCLAIHMGAKVVVLIGFEACAVNGKTHGHDDYQQIRTSVYEERFIPGWRGLRERFEELRVEVINSTPESKIKDFKFIDFKKAINYA